MTGRVCPVHGEWSDTGICRWCEEPKQPEPRKVHPDVPKGSTFCRCGEYAWVSWCPANEREGVIAGVFHGPAQCFKPDAEPPAYDWTRGPEVDDPATLPLAVRSFDLEVALQELWRRMRARAAKEPVCVPDFDAEDAEAARIAAQHAALRWERVARRWEAKHRYTILDVAVQWRDRWGFELGTAYRILESHRKHCDVKP
jgi:hypothetical protein